MKKLVTAARTSADWYEHFAEHMKLDLMDFAYSYITRSGRIDDASAARDVADVHGALRGAIDGQREHDQMIADQVPHDSAGARARSASRFRERYNASRILFDNLAAGRGDRLALTGPAGTRSYAELCAEASRWGHGFASLGPVARRPRAAVPRRYAGLSGGVLRRGARRLRAAADQHADAAGPAAVLSLGFRRGGCGCRCRILHPLRCRRPARTRRCTR